MHALIDVIGPEVDPHEGTGLMVNDASALLVIRTTWWDPQRAPTVQVIRAPLVDGRVVELDLALDLRTVDHVEVRPVRRPLLDVAGHVRDAERLANTPHDEKSAA